MKIAIVGAGAWGTALALVLHQNGHEITLWGHDPVHLEDMAQRHFNLPYLPDVPLPESWHHDSHLPHAIKDAELLLLAIPSHAFRNVVTELASCSKGRLPPMVSVTKGIEFDSGKTMCGIAQEVLPDTPVATLSGPSLALEVARNVPTAVVVAAENEAFSRHIQSLFHRPAFRIYTSTDILGVELGGALKNIYAIAAGISDGLGFGDNSKAALITRSAAELCRLGVACGARAETFRGLSGLGDLTVTCFSKLSRNRGFGERLGRGEAVETILQSTRSAVEGYPTTRSAWNLASRHNLALPILEAVNAMLYEGKNVRQAVVDLLQRETRAETD